MRGLPKFVNHKWFIDFLHGVISLPDATSFDKTVRLAANTRLALCLVVTPFCKQSRPRSGISYKWSEFGKMEKSKKHLPGEI